MFFFGEFMKILNYEKKCNLLVLKPEEKKWIWKNQINQNCIENRMEKSLKTIFVLLNVNLSKTK